VKKNNKKPTVFVRDFLTEGLVFQLDFNQLLYWLDQNKTTIDPSLNILPSKERLKTVFDI